MTTLANELSARFRVDFVTRTPDRAALAPKVRVVILGARVLVPVTLGRYFERERPTAVLSTLVGPNAVAVAVAHAMPRAMRPRVVVREAHLPSAYLPFRPRLERWTVPTVTRLSYAHADAIVALTQSARDDLAAMLPRGRPPITVIPNPLDLARIDALAAELVEGAHFESRSDASAMIVAVGRLVAKKGFDVLLRAFARLHERRAQSRQHTRLTILGEGPERAALEALARSLGVAANVDFIGYQPNPFKYLARADLFVLSSHAEGMPNALLEALACGTPVVSTDCPSGPRELLEGVQGLPIDDVLVPVGDPAALARAMNAVLAAPPDRALMRGAVTGHDAASVARAYLALLVPESAGLDEIARPAGL